MIGIEFKEDMNGSRGPRDAENCSCYSTGKESVGYYKFGYAKN
jgi:hypothetical protein